MGLDLDSGYNTRMRRALIVFVGGGIGACLRTLLLAWLAPWVAVLPLPVLLANLLGSFALGVVFVLADEARVLSAETRLFVAVGVLGGFTTFSTFAWGADLLLSDAASLAAGLVYVAASMIGGVVAVWAGLHVGRALAATLKYRGIEPLPSRQTGRTRGGEAAADIATIEAEDRLDAVP